MEELGGLQECAEEKSKNRVISLPKTKTTYRADMV